MISNIENVSVKPELIENAMSDDFEALLDKTFAPHKGSASGKVVKGVIVGIEADHAIIDIGMKAEGRVPLYEFTKPGTEEAKVSVGDTVSVFIETLDDRNGEASLSHEKARREAALDTLENAFDKEETVKGVIFGRVKGGFMVDVHGALAFLPGSQVDVRPIRDMSPLMHTELDFQILKMDRKRANIIVSRRAIMDESRAEHREELLKDMGEGKVLDGVVKNITDYGAFIDLGGVDGLLHITDIAWHRINHPSEVLSVGQNVKVQVIRFNDETKRVSLGIKQLSQDPWETVEEAFPVGKKVTGTITNITDYGAFVELAPGIEGLIHVSEMSWTRKNVHPGKLVSTSQDVDVLILEIDREKRRISLGLKQCQANPWEAFADQHPVDSTVKGVVRNVTDFGIFVGLNEEIDGLVHMSDISWDVSGEEALANYRKGEELEAKVLSIDPDKERVSLGIKQLAEGGDAVEGAPFKRGSAVKGSVVEVDDKQATVELEDEWKGVISGRDASSDRTKQNTSTFNVGDKVEAQVIRLNAKDKVATLSVKALEISQEKEAVKAYTGKKSSGNASLGDLLGEALESKK